MRSLWREWPRVGTLLAEQKKVLFLLDFDGTLAPLASAPGKVRFPKEIHALLGELRSARRVSVAVLSGRSLPDVRSSVALTSLYYGGNHGLEIQGPGVCFRHRQAASAAAVIAELAGRLRTDLRRVPGVVVENKSLTLSVHHRRVPRAHLPGLQRMLRRLRIQGATLPLQWKKGHEVWEALPRVAWNKGAAALYLIRRLRRPFAVALGDDRTDEDLFAAVKGKGVSIRVGRKRASRADYYLGGQWQVSRFLALAKRVLSSTT